MTDWDKLNYIEYLDYTFYQDDIKGGSLLRNRDLLSASLAIDTFSPVVECADPSIQDFTRDTPLYYYRAGQLRGVFYVQSIQRISGSRYSITAQSAIGLLDRGRHMGGIYNGEEAGEVLPDITGGVPITVKTSLAKQKLYGWLPIATPRANLSQALFALGSDIRTGMDGTLYAAFLWDGLAGVRTWDRTYREGGSVTSDGRITGISVTEHQFLQGGDVTTLFEGTAQEGQEITFDGPMYDLSAAGVSILRAGANYAVLSGGAGTLTGRPYIHNTRLVTRTLLAVDVPNLKEFPDSTLVSLVNSAAVADRVAEYCRHNQTVEEDIVYTSQSPGDRLQIPDPFDLVQTDVCLESAEITLSATLKARIRAVKGYIPPKSEEVEYFDAVELLTGSGTFEFPEGAKSARVVLIGAGGPGGDGAEGGSTSAGGGTMGSAGNNYWKPEKVGDTLTISAASTDKYYSGTTKGGAGGLAGVPGKILEVDFVPDGSAITYSCGTAGTIPGQAGGETIFGLLTSADGSTSETGYLDIVSGTRYGVPGIAGDDGFDGGDAGSSGGGESGGNGIAGRSSQTQNKGSAAQSTTVSSSARITYDVVATAQFDGAGGGGQGGNSRDTQGSPGGNATSNTASLSIAMENMSGKFDYRHADVSSTGFSGGPGGNGAKGRNAPTYGSGGDGGGGGGGAGKSGAAPTSATSTYTLSYLGTGAVKENYLLYVYRSGTTSASGGAPGKGGFGKEGCILVYYKLPSTARSGPIVGSDNRIILDRLGRRIIV